MPAAAWVLLLLALAPGIAMGQTLAPSTGLPSPSPLPGPYAPGADPRQPPPTTVPSEPVLVTSVPPPPGERPTKVFQISPVVSLTEEYSDNFYRTWTNRQDNLRSTLAPGLEVRLDRGTLTGEARYVLSFFHDTSPDDTGFFNSILGRLAWEATPLLTLRTSGRYAESDSPGEADRLGLRRDRREFRTIGASLDADYTLAGVLLQPGYRISHFEERNGDGTTSHTFGLTASTRVLRIHTVSLGYEHLMSETYGVTTVTSDSETFGHEVKASITRELSERSTVGLSASYATRSQERVQPKSETDYQRYNVSLFNSYAIPKTIALRGSIGVSGLESDETSSGPNFSTLTSLSYWLGDLVASLNLERGFSETFGSGQDFGVVETTGVSGSLSYPFTPLLSGLASVSYRKNEFTGVGGRTGTSGDRVEDSLSGSLSLSFQIRRWLGSSFGYSYSEQWSTEESGSIKENRFSLSLNASF